MNAYVRLTAIRTVIIAAIISGATALVGWLMRARFDASVNPIEEIRPSAWTLLGVAAMFVPFLALSLVGLAWWYNRPGAATAANRTIRTAGLVLVVVGLLVASVVIAVNDPLAKENSSIFWRGILSGAIAGVALLASEWVLLDMLRRGADRLRRCEALLEQWHGAGAGRPAGNWEAHLPA